MSFTSNVIIAVEGQEPPKRVLIADDDPALRKALSAHLTRAGYRVCLAESGVNALRVFWSARRFDLLITDLVMPGAVSGRLLAKILRSIDPELSVVFLSGFPPAALSHCHGVEEQEVRLMKPVSKSTLLMAISLLLDERS